MIKSRLRQPVNFLLSRLLLKLRCMYIYMDRTSKERLQDEKYVSLISNGITTQRVNCAVSWPLLGSDRVRPEARGKVGGYETTQSRNILKNLCS